MHLTTPEQGNFKNFFDLFLDISLSINSPQNESIWLGLMIGNSRLHWVSFIGESFQAWDSDRLPADQIEHAIQQWIGGIWPEEIFPPSWVTQIKSTIKNPSHLSLYIASVVPDQTVLWQAYPNAHIITLDQIPLEGIYPTLGIDRALAVWGAGESFGWPILVIDAGTALTITGADEKRQLIGGAILPGLGLQLQYLAQQTAALPETTLPDKIPQRWALNTPAAIQSGVVYTVLAGIRDFINAWWQEFPQSRIILTGGDRTLILTYLQAQFPEVAAKVTVNANLIFLGMRSKQVSSNLSC